jgi:acyl carrier protein
MASPTPPSTVDLKAAVRQYLRDNVVLAGGLDDLTDEASFLERNLLDSTGVLELVAFIEDRFGFKVGDDEIVPDNLDSIALVAAYVQRKLGAGA